MNLVEMNQQKELAALFAEIDVDNSGELERDEVKIMVERMG
jgi:Ca2+-binding EF-hand superfamily protein